MGVVFTGCTGIGVISAGAAGIAAGALVANGAGVLLGLAPGSLVSQALRSASATRAAISQ